jgi:hypothetical protein
MKQTRDSQPAAEIDNANMDELQQISMTTATDVGLFPTSVA